jgi:glycine cleavage system transcriptional repressor
MNKLLALSALGPDIPSAVQDLASAVHESGCNILECRITRFGQELGAQLLVAGNWRTVSRLEQSLPELAGRLGMELTAHATEIPEAQQDMVPYAIDLIAVDQPGIMSRIARFLAQRKVRINDFSSSAYTAQTTGTRMLSLHVSVAIPAHLHIASLREDFMMLCDELNLDAVLEPMKG